MQLEGMQERQVTIRLITDMLGTVPGDKNLYETYIESKKPEELKGDVEFETVQEQLDVKGYTGFHQDEQGLFVYDYLVKGFIKHAGNVLKDTLGVKNLRSKLSDFLFVGPRRIYFHKHEPDGLLERPLRAQTAQGQRVTIARSDTIKEGTEITFQIRWIWHKDFNEETIKKILAYGMFQGLGQFRNGGYGRFEVVEFK